MSVIGNWTFGSAPWNKPSRFVSVLLSLTVFHNAPDVRKLAAMAAFNREGDRICRLIYIHLAHIVV